MIFIAFVGKHTTPHSDPVSVGMIRPVAMQHV